MKIFRRTRWRRGTTSPSSKLFITVAAVLAAALLPEALPLQAQDRQQEQIPPQEGRQRHIVRPGDTLWDLAQFYLTDPFLWPEIYRLNTMVIEDPHWIYPDEQLLVPGPGDIVDRELPGEGIPGEGEVVVRPPEEEIGAVETIEAQQAQTIFAGREAAGVSLTYARGEIVPPVSVSEWDYLRSGMLVPLRELGPRGEVIEPAAARSSVNLIGDYLAIPRYGRIYVSHPGGDPPDLGDRMLLFRIDREVKGYGWVVRPTGLITIAAVHEDVSTAIVTEIFHPIEIGNSVIPLERFETQPGVFAEPVATGPAAELIALLDDQIVVSIEDIGFIDIGRNQGVDVGDEFELFAPPRESDTGFRLPEEPIARGRVVRVTEGTATLRVIDQQHPAIMVGMPVRMVAKMPS